MQRTLMAVLGALGVAILVRRVLRYDGGEASATGGDPVDDDDVVPGRSAGT